MTLSLFFITAGSVILKRIQGLEISEGEIFRVILTAVIAIVFVIFSKSKSKKDDVKMKTKAIKEKEENKTIENHSTITSKSCRFFYAKEIYETWPKLFVLSTDGKLYCEYLDHRVPSTSIKQFDFNTFKAEDFKWGGYQPIVEITYEQAKATVLIKQSNWIDKYLESL